MRWRSIVNSLAVRLRAAYLGVFPHRTVRLWVTATVWERGRGAHVWSWRGGQLVLHISRSVHLHGNQVLERLWGQEETKKTRRAVRGSISGTKLKTSSTFNSTRSENHFHFCHFRIVAIHRPHQKRSSEWLTFYRTETKCRETVIEYRWNSLKYILFFWAAILRVMFSCLSFWLVCCR